MSTAAVGLLVSLLVAHYPEVLMSNHEQHLF